MARYIVDVVESKKAEDIVLLDLRPALIADFFVICNGNSDRQLKALAENVREEVKNAHGKIPFSTEGAADSGWILMDYGNIVVHLFLEGQRRYYDLEGLWRKEGSVLLRIQ